jgi:selenocysteine lyase/cysteine desulfurase
MEIREAKHHFPGTRDKTFLDAACVGLAPAESRLAIERFLDRALMCPDRDASTHHIALDQARATAVLEGARLLEAGDDEIALVESTTHGLNVIAAAIPFQPHENVVICDLEFLQVAIPWLKLAERGGLREVRVACNRQGAVPVEAFAEHVDADTRAVVVSSVQWTNGFAVDLQGLAGLCRAHGALLVVDAIQQLGATRLSVRDTPADVVVAGGHKWLNAPFGCGLLYVRRSTLPELRMPSWGYLGLDPPEGGWGRYFATPESTPVRIYDFPTTAKSLEINGTANYPGAVGLGASLELINGLGITNIEAHVQELTDRLHDELPRLGVRVVTRPEREARSGITTFEVSDVPAENEAFLQALLDERVYVAMRYTSGVGGIRISTHLYNDHDDVDRLIQVMRSLLGRRALHGGALRGSGAPQDELHTGA